VKRDLVIALIAAAVTIAVCLGISMIHPAQPPKAAAAAAKGPAAGPGNNVVMRVNGEPVTEAEFEIAFQSMPEQMQQQFASAQGRSQFAEQLIRLKILEQEGRRLGVERDPKVVSQLSVERTNVLAAAAAQKLAATPNPAAVKKFYSENSSKFETLDVSHILIAYQGGQVPPRKGKPLSRAAAMDKALAIRQQIDRGGDFAALARSESDDAQGAPSGGHLGPVGHGMLPPELEGPVFALKEGEVSKPIPTRFGIHIFKAGKRSSQAIEQVSGAISQRVQQQQMLDQIEKLRKSAKVDFAPKYFPERAKTPAPPPAAAPKLPS
jgi:peptidyl-prolyl cis-trans isomerase C